MYPTSFFSISSNAKASYYPIFHQPGRIAVFTPSVSNPQGSNPHAQPDNQTDDPNNPQFSATPNNVWSVSPPDMTHELSHMAQHILTEKTPGLWESFPSFSEIGRAVVRQVESRNAARYQEGAGRPEAPDMNLSERAWASAGNITRNMLSRLMG